MSAKDRKTEAGGKKRNYCDGVFDEEGNEKKELEEEEEDEKDDEKDDEKEDKRRRRGKWRIQFMNTCL